jgi:hypothetical protein
VAVGVGEVVVAVGVGEVVVAVGVGEVVTAVVVGLGVVAVCVVVGVVGAGRCCAINTAASAITRSATTMPTTAPLERPFTLAILI